MDEFQKEIDELLVKNQARLCGEFAWELNRLISELSECPVCGEFARGRIGLEYVPGNHTNHYALVALHGYIIDFDHDGHRHTLRRINRRACTMYFSTNALYIYLEQNSVRIRWRINPEDMKKLAGEKCPQKGE